MAGGKMSARQKMINMMYLVLTALLALNVSREVVEAFAIVEDGMKESITAFEEKIDLIDETFQGKVGKEPNADVLYGYSQDVTKEIDGLVDYIEDARTNIVYKNGVAEEGNENKDDDINVATRYFIEEENGKNGKAFQDKINNTRDKILDLYSQAPGIDEEAISRMKGALSLNAEDDAEKDATDPTRKWYYSRFHEVPTTGAETILTDIVNRAKSAEASINESLLKQLGEVQYKFDKLAAQVNATSSYIAAGGKYDAKIMVSAGSSALNGKVFYGPLDKDKLEKDSIGLWVPYTSTEDDVPLRSVSKEVDMSGGIAKYEGTNSVGSHAYSGVVQIAKPGFEGEFDYYPFEAEYKVAGDAASSIAATKMNVLYRGLDNPVQIAVGGATPGSVSASITSGSLSPSGNGEYTVKPGATAKATIRANGTNSAGSPVSAAQEFRVLKVPNPQVTVGGQLTGGSTTAGKLKTYGAVICKMDNFVFEGVRFNVKGFEFILSNNGQVFRTEVSGPSFNAQAKSYLDQASSGDLIVLDRVIAVGPDGERRNLGSVTFTIQ